jgi:protein-S-isoprenylcysteine O-methyltransferase Ste14
MSTLIHKIYAFIILLIAAVIGYVSFIAFLFFLYAGSLGWIRLNLSESGSLMINGVLCLAFFLQHSGMIRRSFRRSLSSVIQSHYQGATYTVASGVILLVFVTFWQGSDAILFEAHGPFRGILRVIFFLSILGMCWGLWALRSIDMFGLDPILRHIRATPIPESLFKIRGPYRWVRHPLYLFMIVLFWSCPVLTTDRLLFNILWTIWVVVATVLEERDLTDVFGDAYRDYQAKVPMLLPRGFRPAYPFNKSGNAA